MERHLDWVAHEAEALYSPSAMLRALVTIILAPVAVIFAWLALGERGVRADFVVACGPLRTIDPHRVSWLDEIQVTSALFEGLTRLDPQTYQPRAGAAEGWSVSDDGLQYTFHIRQTARWSNGAALTAGSGS